MSIFLILFLLYSAKCFTKNEITLKTVYSGKQKILSDAFDRNSYPTSIEINGVPQQEIKNEYQFEEIINTIKLTWDYEITTMSKMFQYLAIIESVDLSKFDSSNVIEMESTFKYCLSLKSIDFTNFNTSKVENMNFMFSGCKKLERLNLVSFDISQVTSFEEMFKGCSSLKTLNLEGFSFEPNTSTIDMFKDCNESMVYCIKNIPPDVQSQLKDFPNK